MIILVITFLMPNSPSGQLGKIAEYCASLLVCGFSERSRQEDTRVFVGQRTHIRDIGEDQSGLAEVFGFVFERVEQHVAW